MGNTIQSASLSALLCPAAVFKRTIGDFMLKHPATAWHLRGSETRIYDVVSEASRRLVRGATVVDLGCLPANIPIGFHAAGLLPLVNYIGTCLEAEDDPLCKLALSLGVELRRVNLDPRFSLFPEVAQLSCQVPFADGAADMVLMTEVLEHLVWPHSMLTEAARLLKPGGVVIGSTPNATNIGVVVKTILGLGAGEWYENSHLASETWMKHVRFYTFRDIRMLFKAHGFEVVVEKYRSYDDVYAARGLGGKMLRIVRSLFHVVPWWREKLFFVARRA